LKDFGRVFGCSPPEEEKELIIAEFENTLLPACHPLFLWRRGPG
jgi:hypothetical protein